MRVLLLGEYSGFFTTLKDGLIECGHEVTFAAAPDSFKEIPGIDVLLESKFSFTVFRKIDLLLQFISVIFKGRGYDVVFVNNQGFFRPLILAPFLILWLYVFNKKMFLSACGVDYPFVRFGKKGGYKWWIYDPCEECEGVESAPFQGIGDRFITFILTKIVAGVIPTSYGYHLAWMSYCPSKTLPVIGLPALGGEHIAGFNVAMEKGEESAPIVLFHGLNRPCHKGSRFIIPALNLLQQRYPEKVRAVVVGGLPLKEYLALLDSADIVIDQCLGYDYQSMNTLAALQAGKVVAVAAVDESFSHIGIEDHPIVQIAPDQDLIYRKLEELIKNPVLLRELRVESREWVDRWNNYRTIAEAYVRTFDSFLTGR